MLSRICRFLSVATLGVSIASAAVATLFGFLIVVSTLFQSCAGSYRQEHPHLDLVTDSIGLPLMSFAFAAMAWQASRICNDLMVDSSFNWVMLHDGILIVSGLFLVTGANLTTAVFTCNRYAAIWSYCHATAGTS
jgi:hypothetical protein